MHVTVSGILLSLAYMAHFRTEISKSFPQLPRAGTVPRAQTTIDKIEFITYLVHQGESSIIEKRLDPSKNIGHRDRRGT